MKKYGLIVLLLIGLAGFSGNVQAGERFGESLNPTLLIEGPAAARRVQFDPAGTSLLIDYADGSAQRYSLSSGESIFSSAVTVSPSGIAAEATKTAVALDGSPFLETAAPVRDLLLNPQGTRLAASLDDHSLKVYDTASSTELVTLAADGDTLLFNPAGDIMAADNPALNQVILWGDSGTTIVLPGQAPVAFSPDGQWIGFVSDATSLMLSRMEDVLAREQGITWGGLTAHYAAVTAMVFTPDSALVVTASRDGTISLWNVATHQQIRVLMGHRAGVNALAVSPDGTLLASVDDLGDLRLWDIPSGEPLGAWAGTGAALLDVTFAEDQIVTAGQDGRVIVWSAGGTPVDLPSYHAPSAAAAPLALEDGIHGSARRMMTAGDHPLHPVGCLIAEDERVVALGRSVDGGLLLYAASCEGPVWTSLGTRYFDWEERGVLEQLPVVMPETLSTPRLRITDYDQICASVENTRAAVEMDDSATRYLYPPENLPSPAQAALADGSLTLVCHEYKTVPVENCHYLDQLLYSYIFTRLRLNDTVRLVDYASGEVIAQRYFEGADPPSCPRHLTRGEVIGDPVLADVWAEWALQQTGHPDLLPVRSRVAGWQATPLYVRPTAESNAGSIPPGTAVNPVARSGDGWVLSLLPDMSEAWIPTDKLTLALPQDSLPEINRAASTEAAISPEQQVAGLTDYRPLGRVEIFADQLVVSADGLYIVGIQQQEIGALLGLWDVRGGQQLWQVSLPERQWEMVMFSPDAKTLLVKTNAPYPAEEEIRLAFYDTLTGVVISETGDIDIIDSPVIPGNMPQQLDASPRYTKDGRLVVVDYWRRAEAPRCAVWRVATAQLLWEMDGSCGTLSEDGHYLIVERPYTEIFSAYNQLVIYEVETGVIITASVDEAINYKWLTNQTVFIERPYGEAPVIWNIVDGTTAVLELPQPMGSFLPEALHHVMYSFYGDQTYVWDMTTGELLGSVPVQGTVVEQGKRVLILQEYLSDDGEQKFLRAVNLENGDELWEIEWAHSYLSIRADGFYGFAFNDETWRMDIFDLQTGRSVGIIPVLYYDFLLTPDWEWLVQFDGYSQFTVWGSPSAVDLFDNPPDIRITAETQSYYEPNTRFPYRLMVNADQYLWVTERTAGSDWVEVDDSYGTRFWIPTANVEFLTDVEQIPIR
jgi:WD40 repeat protein